MQIYLYIHQKTIESDQTFFFYSYNTQGENSIFSTIYTCCIFNIYIIFL